MIRALVVDDEPLARREMARLLAEVPDVLVVSQAATLTEARDALEAFEPDVVFLDVALGRDSGFELLGSIPGRTRVVFVTAHAEHAVAAFGTDAVDYLLKPVAMPRLHLTLARIREDVDGEESAGGMRGGGDWMYLRQDAGHGFVKVADLAYVRAEGDQTMLHARDGRVFHSSTPLRAWLKQLPGADFVQVHRSALVNLAHVRGVSPGEGAVRVAVASGEVTLELSRRHAARIRAALGGRRQEGGHFM
ncbi:MAG: response regulator LytR [Gemmatimonadetes bacterium]|nr:response regulator LytR [Gemmatimonadota bacterium]